MWYDRIKHYYDKGLYTKEQIKVFVPKYITASEYQKITGEKYII